MDDYSAEDFEDQVEFVINFLKKQIDLRKDEEKAEESFLGGFANESEEN